MPCASAWTVVKRRTAAPATIARERLGKGTNPRIAGRHSNRVATVRVPNWNPDSYHLPPTTYHLLIESLLPLLDHLAPASLHRLAPLRDLLLLLGRQHVEDLRLHLCLCESELGLRVADFDAERLQVAG